MRELRGEKSDGGFWSRNGQATHAHYSIVDEWAVRAFIESAAIELR